MKRISKGWRRGSSSQGTASTVTSSGADSRGSARSGGMASIAFTGSSGGRSRHHNLLMETNMAFENGSDGGRTKRSHGTGFFAFSQVGRGGGVRIPAGITHVTATAEVLPQDKTMAHNAHLMCRCTCGTCLQQLACVCVDAKQ